MASDSSAVVPTVVTKVEGEETCAGPPPYSEETSMEGKGVYCNKCHNHHTDSWYKVHTCLNAKEEGAARELRTYTHRRSESCVLKRGPSVGYGRRWTHLPPPPLSRRERVSLTAWFLPRPRGQEGGA